MISLDRRTRVNGYDELLDPVTFVRSVAPEAIAENGRDAGLGAIRLGLPPLTLDVGDESVTLVPGDRLDVRLGRSTDGVAIAVDEAAFSELMQDSASAFALQFTGRGRLSHGSFDDFVGWEPVLRSLLDGRPVYEPGTIDFRDRDGSELDLHRSFRVDDDPEDVNHFLAEAGYLHLEGVFTEDEMAAVSADLDVAIADAARDDGNSWWARTSNEGWYACRILGFNHHSATLRDLLHSDRFRSIAGFSGDRWIQRDPDRSDAAEGLLKKIGVVEGASDVSWHKDCSMGGHSRSCSGLVVGISITGAGRDNGELGVVAGSNRANIAPLGIVGIDLPRVALPTRTGDLTVHCGCTLHMSRPPVSAERRVSYTGFGLAPREGDKVDDRTPEQIRADRAELNDHVRRRQDGGTFGERMGSFDLD